MNVKIDVDMSPEELRRLLGLPDVEPIQRELLEKLRKHVVEGMDGYDPVKLLQPYLSGTLASWDFLQKMISAAGKGGKSIPSKTWSVCAPPRSWSTAVLGRRRYARPWTRCAASCLRWIALSKSCA